MRTKRGCLRVEPEHNFNSFDQESGSAIPTRAHCVGPVSSRLVPRIVRQIWNRRRHGAGDAHACLAGTRKLPTRIQYEGMALHNSSQSNQFAKTACLAASGM